MMGEGERGLAYLLSAHLLRPGVRADIFPVLVRSRVRLLWGSESFFLLFEYGSLSDVCLGNVSHTPWVVFGSLSKVFHRVGV